VPENNGIQNFGSVVNGPQAAGRDAHAEQTVNQAPAAADDQSSAQAALAQAVEELRAQLAQLRAEQAEGGSGGDGGGGGSSSSSSSVPDADAQTAEIALRDLEKTALQPAPDHNVLKRRVRTIVDALGEASTLATALTVLETAVRKLIGLP
jgi:hypothetical protein